MTTRVRIAGALLATAMGASASQSETAPVRRTGSVLYATTSRLYLDAGSREGLAPGQIVQLQKGTCRVEQVSATRATCLGTGRAGDTFGLPPPPPQPPASRLAPLPAPSVVEQRRSTLGSAPHPKVDFHQGSSGLEARQGSADLGIGHTTWWTSRVGSSSQERVDALIRDLPLGAGFTLDVDLSARRWSRRSGPISFRPDDATQLYVWEASISRRTAGGPAFSVGRVRPYRVPGQVILDGAQAGWRTVGGTEAGIFGGVVPDAVTLAPSVDHGTFGAYWIGQHSYPGDSSLRFLRHEARIAFIDTADLGKRVEGEALLEARITRQVDFAFDVRGGGTVSGGVGSMNSVGLEALRVDVSARPLDSVNLLGSFRYDGLSIPELDGPGRVLNSGAVRHADFSAAWEPMDTLRFSVVSGLSSDLLSHTSRRWIGPEIALPRLLGDSAGLSAGYFREDGWAPGSSAWLQLLARSHGVFQLIARLSWFRTAGIAPVDLDELGASAAIQAQLARYVALRLSVFGRTTLNGQTSPFGPATGQVAFADLEIAGTF
ncbi:MAG TPA: hypothetical protein VII08_21650 [Myxococcales bacterium]